MSADLKNSTLLFLKDLHKNNNREWFNENKDRYRAAHTNVADFVEVLIEEIGKFDEEILKIDAKKALFRIYRDVRFSKDKSPYKTNFGAGLGMGKGNRISGYYLHIEPGKSFLAGGVYQPDTTVLKEIRKEISINSNEFLSILEQDEFRNNFRGLSVEQKLQRVPAGFEKDDPMAEFLKLKNFIVVHPVSNEALMKEDAAKNFAQIFKSIKPLNDFLGFAFPFNIFLRTFVCQLVNGFLHFGIGGTYCIIFRDSAFLVYNNKPWHPVQVDIIIEIIFPAFIKPIIFVFCNLVFFQTFFPLFVRAVE